MTWTELWKLIGSDWTQLVPSLIVSLFTGLVVGLVLAFSQRRAERRQQRRRIIEQWTPLRSRLTGFFATRLRADGFAVDMGRARPMFWMGLLEIVQDVPLRSWASDTQDPEIRDLADLIELGYQVRTQTELAWRDITDGLAQAGLADRSGLTIPVIDLVLAQTPVRYPPQDDTDRGHAAVLISDDRAQPLAEWAAHVRQLIERWNSLARRIVPPRSAQ